MNPRFELQAAVKLLIELFPNLKAVYAWRPGGENLGQRAPVTHLALLGPPGQPTEVGKAEYAMSAALHAHIDIMDLRAESPARMVEVVGQGSVIFEHDRSARLEFEMYALAMNADWNEKLRVLSIQSSNHEDLRT